MIYSLVYYIARCVLLKGNNLKNIMNSIKSIPGKEKNCIDILYKPKSFGGLGLIQLESQYQALFSKTIIMLLNRSSLAYPVFGRLAMQILNPKETEGDLLNRISSHGLKIDYINDPEKITIRQN